jgi:hypothetical protein
MSANTKETKSSSLAKKYPKLETSRGIHRLRNRVTFAKSNISKSKYPDLLNIQVEAYDNFLQENVPPHKREMKGLQQSFHQNFPT